GAELLALERGLAHRAEDAEPVRSREHPRRIRGLLQIGAVDRDDDAVGDAEDVVAKLRAEDALLAQTLRTFVGLEHRDRAAAREQARDRRRSRDGLHASTTKSKLASPREARRTVSSSRYRRSRWLPGSPGK